MAPPPSQLSSHLYPVALLDSAGSASPGPSLAIPALAIRWEIRFLLGVTRKGSYNFHLGPLTLTVVALPPASSLREVAGGCPSLMEHLSSEQVQMRGAASRTRSSPGLGAQRECIM